MNFPKFHAAIAACAADIGAIRAKQLDCFVRLTMALAHANEISTELKEALHMQINQMFQLGVFQHSFEAELPASDMKWAEDVLVPWLNKLTAAVMQDRLDFEATMKNKSSDNVVNMILDALKKAKSL